MLNMYINNILYLMFIFCIYLLNMLLFQIFQCFEDLLEYFFIYLLCININIYIDINNNLLHNLIVKKDSKKIKFFNYYLIYYIYFKILYILKQFCLFKNIVNNYKFNKIILNEIDIVNLLFFDRFILIIIKFFFDTSNINLFQVQ